jgi:hypothetical protein
MKCLESVVPGKITDQAAKRDGSRRLKIQTACL